MVWVNSPAIGMAHWLSMAVSNPRPALRCQATSCLSRTEAAYVLDHHILPTTQKGARMLLGGVQGGVAVTGDDPILFETYGEFPLRSLDTLLDRAEELLAASGEPKRTVVDLGSGCGRLALYMALSRNAWDVYGVEISPSFHKEAVNAVDRALDRGCMVQSDGSHESTFSFETTSSTSRLSLHLGPAGDFTELLQLADIIFSYSTAFKSSGFSERSSTMVLDVEWNVLLTKFCQSTCLIITTDKALDPDFGWEILDRIDVPNPEVLESIGYIQRLEPRARESLKC